MERTWEGAGANGLGKGSVVGGQALGEDQRGAGAVDAACLGPQQAKD